MKLARYLGLIVMSACLAQPALAEVRIFQARWGVAGPNGRVNGPSCDAQRYLVRACEGRETCELPATNRTLCGDPAQGRQKTLELRYACDDDERIQSFPENALISLRCERAPRGEARWRREPIRVQSAVWGVIGPSGRVEGQRCDASREVARVCNGERSCEMPVENRRLCGDPGREREKTLEISFSCGGDSQTLSFPESSMASLSCDMLDDARRDRNSINVLAARWGRGGEHGRVRDPSCNAAADLANVCNGRDQCQVSVYNRYLCGDPLPGEPKMLEVRFACGGREDVLSFPETSQAILRCPGRDGWRRDDDRR